MAEQENSAAEAVAINPEELGPAERAAFDILSEMCSLSGLEIQPVVRGLHVPYVDVDLTGEDAAAAFGRFGKRLDAFQYLANLVIGRQVGGETRVVLDAAGYRAHRTEVLEKLARDCAAEVKERQEEAELDPLPAHERRIIHNILATDPDIRTYSEGDDPDRRVIIAPA